MLLGKYLNYALVGSALATYAAGEETNRRIGSRKLGNRKNRGYTGGTGGIGKTSFPTLEPTFYPTIVSKYMYAHGLSDRKNAHP